PKLQATYASVLDAGELRRTLKNASLPIGLIRGDGSLQYQSEPDTPMLALVTLNGNLSSSALQVITPTLRTNIRDIGAHYSVNHGNVDVSDMRAHLLGGELTGTMTMRDLTGASQSHLKAALRGGSLADLKSLMNSSSMRQVALQGTANADADAKWGKTFANLVAR